MELSEVMRTAGAVREFTDEPVTDAVLHDILDDARFAPSGGNRQGWRVVVVEDRALRRHLADLCGPVYGEYVAQGQLGETPFSVVRPTAADLRSARFDPPDNPMFAHIEDAPVVLVIAVDLGALAVSDKDLDRWSIVGGGSIYPFVHNILLASRNRGIGGVMTTFLVRAEAEARDLLGLPDGYALASMALLGHPVKQVTRLRRDPVEAFTTIDRFDGPPFTA